MRIIGGVYRSRLIDMPKGVEIRPTQDRVREAIFNILGNISGMAVLDLFSGSGAFGLESLSRGASRATFVENNIRCVQTIEKNLESLQIPADHYDVRKRSALRAIYDLEGEGLKYDIIFMDPPYHKDLAKNCLINLDSCDILSQFATVVVEHYRLDELDFDLETLASDKERKYGDTIITFLKRHAEDTENIEDADI